MANNASSIIKKAIEDAGYRAIEVKHFPLESDKKTIKSFQTMMKLVDDKNNIVYSLNPSVIRFCVGFWINELKQNHKKGQVVPVYDDKERYLMLNKENYFTPRCDPVDELKLRRHLQSLKDDAPCVVCFEAITYDNSGKSCNICDSMLCNQCVLKMLRSSLSFVCPVCRKEYERAVKRTPNV